MAITSTGLNAATNTETVTSTAVENKNALGKDDFMTLLLVQLQYQDPTEPMDSDKILTQTSQLASLESTANTTAALEKLTDALGSTQQFSLISAIGKTADLGSNAIGHDEGATSSFEVYFPDSISSGNIEILDVNGNIVSTMPVEENAAGVYQFDWNGTLTNGSEAESAVYYVTASYVNQQGESKTTRMGTYPIESVKFDSGTTYVKVGSGYVDIESLQEIY